MSFKTHLIGYPSIGKNREFKFFFENYLFSKKNKLQELKLLISIRKIRKESIKIQTRNLEINTNSNFPYDRMMSTMIYLGIIPKRFNFREFNIKQYLEIAKGNKNCKPLEMTKWFNTNYHYLVPEFDENLNLFKNNKFILEDLIVLNFKNETKFPIIGPLTFILLGNNKFVKKEKLILNIFKRYKKILYLIKSKVNYLQIEEPIFSFGLNNFIKKLFLKFYKKLSRKLPKIIFTTYFCEINLNFLNFLKKFKFFGFHFDFNKKYIKNFIKLKSKIISIGIIKGTSIWKPNIKSIFNKIKKLKKYSNSIWLSFSSSLEHIPLSLKREKFNKKLNWFSFANEKIKEISLIRKILIYGKNPFIKKYMENKFSIISFSEFKKTNKIELEKKYKRLVKKIIKKRNKIELNLPKLPTTTIGSFPQTTEIRRSRFLLKENKITYKEYEKTIKKNIKKNIKFQEKIGLDVLVHGEPERTDMVEFFCKNLGGCMLSNNGWVHSYGTRCVKPPIIYSDVNYIKNITTKWIKYAKTITKKELKGILTGPITILKWSFTRENLNKRLIAFQIALAIRQEIKSLSKLGIKIIQIDEPAFKECMPFKKKDVIKYVDWSTKVFKLTFHKLNNLQIHTHICYSNLNKKDIEYFSKLGADVISIESSRSFMRILDIIKNKRLNFQIGIGTYDIHSTRSPSKNEFKLLINKILRFNKNIWINPDCGLKTRKWIEIKKPLINMVKSTKEIRNNL